MKIFFTIMGSSLAKCILIITLCTLQDLTPSDAHAQPIEPTRDIKSKSTATAAVVDLPYKPNDSLFQTVTSVDAMTITEDGSGEVKKEVFDFAKLPFIPAKGPRLRPGGDPEY